MEERTRLRAALPRLRRTAAPHARPGDRRMDPPARRRGTAEHPRRRRRGVWIPPDKHRRAANGHDGTSNDADRIRVEGVLRFTLEAAGVGASPATRKEMDCAHVSAGKFESGKVSISGDRCWNSTPPSTVTKLPVM